MYDFNLLHYWAPLSEGRLKDLLLISLKLLYSCSQSCKLGGDRVGYGNNVHLGNVVHLYAAFFHYSGGNTNGGGIGGYLRQNNAVGRNSAIIAHLERSKDFGSIAYKHIVAYGGMALAAIFTGTAKGDTVVDKAIVAYFRSLTYYYAHSVVNNKALAYCCAWVDFYARAAA